MKIDKTVTFKKSEIVEQIRDMATGIIEDSLHGYIEGDEECISLVESFRDLNGLEDVDLIAMWNDFVGDYWFEGEENKDIEDVLMFYTPVGRDQIIKIWVGNRNPHILDTETVKQNKEC